MHIQAQMNKGKKMKGQQFTPGKGLRNKEEEQEMLLSLSNPAQLGKGKSTGEFLWRRSFLGWQASSCPTFICFQHELAGVLKYYLCLLLTDFIFNAHASLLMKAVGNLFQAKVLDVLTRRLFWHCPTPLSSARARVPVSNLVSFEFAHCSLNKSHSLASAEYSRI